MFSHSKSIGANDPRGGAIFDPRDKVGKIYKRTTIHCYIQNMKALGLVVSEKKIVFMFFSMTPPGVGLVWTPGSRLAGFIKRTTINCYTENMKALGLVVSEKIFFYVFPIASLWELYVSMETIVLI